MVEKKVKVIPYGELLLDKKVAPLSGIDKRRAAVEKVYSENKVIAVVELKDMPYFVVEG